MRFELIETSTHAFGKKTEEVYHYRASDGQQVKFCADPRRSFSFIFFKVDDPVTPNMCSKVVTAFINQGMRQWSYKGGFDEAIRVLDV